MKNLFQLLKGTVMMRWNRPRDYTKVEERGNREGEGEGGEWDFNRLMAYKRVMEPGNK